MINRAPRVPTLDQGVRVLPPSLLARRDEVGFDIRGNRKLQEIACMVQAISRRNILRRYSLCYSRVVFPVV